MKNISRAEAKRRLKAARAAKGMTQSDVAKVMRVNPSTVSDWENDIYHVRYGQLKQLCDLLGLTVAQLEEVRTT